MIGGRKRRREKGAVECIEESVQLLRLCPPRVLAAYYAGSAPFVLGLLYFWADMSRSAAASGRLAGSAFGLALLYIWMKSWHAAFARALFVRLAGEEPPRWSLRRAGQLVAEQAAVQATGLFLLPAAALAAAPLGWAIAFYQNASVLGGGDGEIAVLLRSSWRQANRWPMQNHLLLAVLFVFGIFVFLNVAVALAAAPWIAKTFLGAETLFAAGPWLVLNTTFLAAAAGISWLCIDPLVKAAFAVRCFYGESVETGGDLRAELRDALPDNGRSAVRALLVLPVLVLILASPGPATGSGERDDVSTVTRTTAGGIAPEALDRSIREVMQRTEYAWRMPREKAKDAEADPGGIAAYLAEVGRFLRKTARVLAGWCARIAAWFRELFPEPSAEDGRNRPLSEIEAPIRLFLFALLALAAAVAAVAGYRTWRRRGVETAGAEADTVPSAPDLGEATVGADRLPADGWLRLARDLYGRGELRLAVRALHLAGLAHLGRLGVIDLAVSKSNGDYERELRRKVRGAPDLLAAFARNTAFFDRAWYGTHEVDAETYSRFSENLERILAHADG